eukprot:CAMPEP_0181173958 /NCGR_PEP_ID=MMETSP1096-20121128/3279_1 /TAXON_ID=156174 ORGANISM="Chrysochromulina ericina, Strain CCMP281" /NCGR_SAMPLE_ID=MMETSP1096 /ASSEMBLY_ACC=CAM_ASM_000453 /LENGTH=76 /DNA_ID=CAMNT_0023261825 /DNA_START=1037 /DNA_END=1266 /DNA_ORIENTATION=+
MTLFGGVAGVAPAAYKREDVATEQHLHDADATVGEISAVGLLEWLTVEDTKAGVRAASKATLVLVEADIEQLRALA